MLAGPVNCGKTWVALTMAMAVAAGKAWLGHFGVQQGPVS